MAALPSRPLIAGSQVKLGMSGSEVTCRLRGSIGTTWGWSTLEVGRWGHSCQYGRAIRMSADVRTRHPRAIGRIQRPRLLDSGLLKNGVGDSRNHCQREVDAVKLA